MAEGGFLMDDDMTSSIDALSMGVTDRAREVFEAGAGEVLGYAQHNAPWDDRTGMARDGLVTEVTEEGGEIFLSLAHTVDYGQWLETIQNGRFAIIMPTLELYSAELIHRAGGAVVGEGE